ncbi:MAG: SGNH/GDSL hydrolase family protein [Blautia sp.]|nr:SGNH/GDSL hydrolase family protein [Blautia sp.]
MKTILCIGDSITDCGRLFDFPPLGNGYVSLLASHFRERSSEIRFINKGVDGFTVLRLLERAASEYLHSEPDLVTILIGINDVAMIMDAHGSPRFVEKQLDRFEENYRHLLSVFREERIPFLVMEPFLFDEPWEMRTWQSLRMRMSDRIRSLAEEAGCPFVALQEPLMAAGPASALTIDGVHLTGKGHAVLTSQLLPVINGML